MAEVETRRVLIICTGNTCRSQMAEGLLRSFGPGTEVFSAGVRPEKVVNPLAVKVMQEIGIDIGSQQPSHVNEFTDEKWDFVITVCKGANAVCPVFNGEVGQRMHIAFDDPADATGTEEERLQVYRRVRDELKEAFLSFYQVYIRPQPHKGCGCGCSN